MAKDETQVSDDQVWSEHLKDVHVGAHWAYLGAVLIGGLVLMVALIAALGATPA